MAVVRVLSESADDSLMTYFASTADNCLFGAAVEKVAVSQTFEEVFVGKEGVFVTPVAVVFGGNTQAAAAVAE